MPSKFLKLCKLKLTLGRHASNRGPLLCVGSSISENSKKFYKVWKQNIIKTEVHEKMFNVYNIIQQNRVRFIIL